MSSTRLYQSEVDKMARQLGAVRQNKVRRMKSILAKQSYGIKASELAKSLFLARRS